MAVRSSAASIAFAVSASRSKGVSWSTQNCTEEAKALRPEREKNIESYLVIKKSFFPALSGFIKLKLKLYFLHD